MAKTSKKETKFINKPVDFILLITVILLLAFGIIMVLSASSPSALAETGDSYEYVKRQAFFAVIGLILMYIISKIDYRRYEKFYGWAYIISVVILLMVQFVGYSVNGAKRWINIGGITSFQPSEAAKIGLIVFYAALLARYKDKIKTLKCGFILPFVFLIPVIAILFFLQDHLSACIVIILITSIMMLIAGTKLRYFMTIGLAGVTAGGVGMYLLAKFTEKGAFRIQRVLSFLDPWQDPQGSGWQIIQSLYAIGSGGLFGVGLRSK